MKLFGLVVFSFLIAGTAGAKIDTNRSALLLEDPPALSDYLDNFGHAYTRVTAINWTSDAYNAIVTSGLNTYPFTSTRTTLFIENGLYMYDDVEAVNSGYYTKNSQSDVMYHFALEAGKDARNNADAAFSDDSYSGGVDVDEYYVGMHTINSNLDTFTALFTHESTKQGVITWSSTSLSETAMTLKNLGNVDEAYTLEKAMMYLTAPCYTNPVIGEGEQPYFTFKEVKIIYNSAGELIFKLYANETAQLNEDSGLFATATISNPGTTIAALDSHINPSV